jgi:hypothetical protein
MLSRQKNLTAYFVANRLFPKRYFLKSWAFDYLQSLILYPYVPYSGYKQLKKVLNTENCEK